MRNVRELQEDHVESELVCHDRLYYNLFVPILNSLGGVVVVIKHMLEYKIPLPVAFKEIRDLFVCSVEQFAEDNGLVVATDLGHIAVHRLAIALGLRLRAVLCLDDLFGRLDTVFTDRIFIDTARFGAGLLALEVRS